MLTMRQKKARDLYESGLAVVDVAKEMGIHVVSAHNLLSRAGVERRGAKNGWQVIRYGAWKKGAWQIGNTRQLLEQLTDKEARFLVQRLSGGDKVVDVIARIVKEAAK